jgi:hypothetical protein
MKIGIDLFAIFIFFFIIHVENLWVFTVEKEFLDIFVLFLVASLITFISNDLNNYRSEMLLEDIRRQLHV